MFGDRGAQKVEADDVVAQLGTESGGNCLGYFNGSELNGALTDRVTCERGGYQKKGRTSIEEALHLPVSYHAVEKAGPTGAIARTEHRSYKRKGTGRLNEQPARTVRHALLVQLGQSPVKIVVDQGYREIGSTLNDANPKCGEGQAEFLFAAHVERLDAHAAIIQVLLGNIRGQAQAGPIARHRLSGGCRCRDDITPFYEPLEGLLNLLGRKIPAQVADELSETPSTLRDCRGERAREFAVKKELPVLRVETHHVRRQHINREVRRELRNVFAGIALQAGKLCVHDVSTRVLPGTSVAAWKAYSPSAGIFSSSSRPQFSTTFEVQPAVNSGSALRRDTELLRQKGETWIGRVDGVEPGHDEFHLSM